MCAATSSNVPSNSKRLIQVDFEVRKPSKSDTAPGALGRGEDCNLTVMRFEKQIRGSAPCSTRAPSSATTAKGKARHWHHCPALSPHTHYFFTFAEFEQPLKRYTGCMTQVAFEADRNGASSLRMWTVMINLLWEFKHSPSSTRRAEKRRTPDWPSQFVRGAKTQGPASSSTTLRPLRSVRHAFIHAWRVEIGGSSLHRLRSAELGPKAFKFKCSDLLEDTAWSPRGHEQNRPNRQMDGTNWGPAPAQEGIMYKPGSPYLRQTKLRGQRAPAGVTQGPRERTAGAVDVRKQR
ncbi:hypothetical protein DFP72DRAFT_1052143 [Ephemerocybe angulata]|uniref:Uncharacterized protein n=1 Tax=Ephemerocybe angulata TaxID=980116 RepID=A0A8H6LW53_9AGAR|nr:hypothetical protein DFP72DRAFT_1052143 [Tulosesus angulatus]